MWKGRSIEIMSFPSSLIYLILFPEFLLCVRTYDDLKTSSFWSHRTCGVRGKTGNMALRKPLQDMVKKGNTMGQKDSRTYLNPRSFTTEEVLMGKNPSDSSFIVSQRSFFSSSNACHFFMWWNWTLLVFL